MDATGTRIKIRDGTATKQVVYVVMGINVDGERDIQRPVLRDSLCLTS